MEHSAEQIVAHCSGAFSTLTLFETHLAIDRGQLICDFHEIVFRSHPVRKSRIEIAEITDLSLTASMILPPLFVIRYAGCSQLTGSILHDAILENVHMLSFVDNRPFYALYHALDDMISEFRSRALDEGDTDAAPAEIDAQDPSDPEQNDPERTEPEQTDPGLPAPAQSDRTATT